MVLFLSLIFVSPLQAADVISPATAENTGKPRSPWNSCSKRKRDSMPRDPGGGPAKLAKAQEGIDAKNEKTVAKPWKSRRQMEQPSQGERKEAAERTP
jgi:hypothetical protein